MIPLKSRVFGVNAEIPLPKKYKPTEALRWQGALMDNPDVKRVYVNTLNGTDVFVVVHRLTGSNEAIEKRLDDIIAKANLPKK